MTKGSKTDLDATEVLGDDDNTPVVEIDKPSLGQTTEISTPIPHKKMLRLHIADVGPQKRWGGKVIGYTKEDDDQEDRPTSHTIKA